MSVLAIGGTGQVGSLVVERLAAEGCDVRVLTREPGSAHLPDGARAVKGDALDAASVRAALDGVDTMFLLNPVVPDELTRALIALELADRAGASVVYLSMVNADALPDVPHAVAKHAAERSIEARGLGASVLRANYFIQNDGELREPLIDAGIYGMPIGEIGAAMIDVRDLAEVAALEVLRRERASEALPFELIDVSGPDILTASAICGLWTAALGRPVRYAGDDLDAFEARIAEHVPSAMALDVALMFRGWQRIGVLPGAGAADALAVRLGRPLRTYAAFTAECAAKWQSDDHDANEGA